MTDLNAWQAKQARQAWRNDRYLWVCTCGHTFDGHTFAYQADGTEPLPCLHEDGCEAFNDSGERRDPPPPPPALNFWELEG